MKYLPLQLLTLVVFTLLMSGCEKSVTTKPGPTCSEPVKAGETFELNGKSVTVLELHSDLWCVCCNVCDCFDSPYALLLVEGDSVRVGGEFMSITLMPQTGEYNGRTITMVDLNDGSCENQLAPEDLSACFSIE